LTAIQQSVCVVFDRRFGGHIGEIHENEFAGQLLAANKVNPALA
jgi:hypothetical protein